MKFKNIIYSLLTEDQEGTYKKYFSDVKRETFIKIVSADPKTKIENDKIIRLGSYYKFLVDMYRNGNLKFEDLPKANEYLGLVYKYGIKIGQMKIETISDLYDIVKDKIVKTNTSLSQIISTLDKSEYSVKLNEGSWFVVVPLTEKAAAYLGVNTEWCTTWGTYCLNPNYKDRTNHFNTYNPQGPLYIIVNKENEADKYQLHFPSNQLKNPADNEISSRPKFFNEKLEVKRYFFPSLYISEPKVEDVKSELTKGKKFLDESDLSIYRDVIYAEYGETNPFIAILNKADEDELLNFITDENVSFTISRSSIEFEMKNLPSSIEGYNDALRTLRMWEDNAYNDVSDSEYDNYKYETENILEGYLTTYYEKNRGKLIDLFGLACKTFDSFFDFAKNSGILKDDTIRDKYIDGFTEGTGAAMAGAAREQINEYEAILDINTGWSDKSVYIPIEKMVEFVAEKEVYNIDSFESFISEYIEYYNLPDNDYLEYPEYDYSYPSQEFMDIVFDVYFENRHDEFYDSEDDGCKELKNKFILIFEKQFDEKGVFENEFVKIELKQPWFQNFSCEKGVDLTLLNKKTNETHNGYVQIDNLMNHMQIEPLFERLSLSKILKDIK